MGVVYEAEQEHPRRIVALKVMKPGLAGSELLRRFEHESRALGRLQHPGIAQIYEAGTADAGFGPQPYFAMEFIRGESLREYAQALHLNLRSRLELMIKVCDAVHHAHQRGVIHRDLKPGNILVETNVDTSGQPKILDFGVARSMDTDAHATRQTDLGQLVGTLAYMSPEQVLGDPLELDTRSDVYALGVILYELLAERLPYEISRKLPEAVQTIREEDPAPLSSISRTYRGDVETIVAKALEKEKARRYSSAADLAADIRRYLEDEPIVARPASTAYQLSKFARRHKSLVAGVAAVFVVLAGGVLMSAWEAARANTEAATAKAIDDFLQNDLLAQASPNRRPDPDLKVRAVLDRAAARIAGRFDRQPLVEASLRQTIGGAYLDLGLSVEAQREIERAILLRRRVLGEQNPDTLASLSSLAQALHAQGKNGQSEALDTRILEIRRRTQGENNPATLSTMNDLIGVYRDETKYAQAAALMAKALEIQQRTLGEEHPETLRTLLNLAAVTRNQGKYPEAEKLFEKILHIQRRTLGEEHPETLATLDLLALQYREEGKFAQSEKLFTQSLELHRRVLGREHPDTLQTMNMVAVLSRVNGKYAQAEALLSQALEIGRRTLGEEHPITIQSMAELPGVYWVEGKYAEAEPLYLKALAIRRRLLGPEQDDTVSTMNNLATLYMSEGKYAEAEPLFTKVVEIRRRVRGEDEPRTLIGKNNLALLYRKEGKYAQAEALFAKVLEARRRVLGADNPDTLKTMNGMSLLYLEHGRYPQAEALLREALSRLEKKNRDTWERYDTESMLGASLAGQGKYGEAKPLLLSGYQGLLAREATIPAPSRSSLQQAGERIARLHKR